MLPNTNTVPKLAPPGAGLPKPELLIANLLFRWARWRTSREKAVANFARETVEILKRVEGCDAAMGSERVLIRRLPGLEDSSRYWSVFMTLDHLRIVNRAIAGTITGLAAGRVSPRVASTAQVKPSADVDPGIVTSFQDGCRELEQAAGAIPDLATQATYAHPWFGPLDAAGWHFMAGFHMSLHRRQIEAILKGLGRPR